MKRLITLVLVSISLSVGMTLLATWVSLTIRSARHEHLETTLETPVV
jgi:hypothetical protein